MKAVQIKQYGGTEAIEINQDVTNPVAQSGQVVVEVPISYYWQTYGSYLL